MQNTIVHHEATTSLEAVGTKVKPARALIKIGLDVHARVYVAVAQYDHLLPKAARRFGPVEFVPWVEGLLQQGHEVHVVYEACGFGFILYRQLVAAGAHCYVIAPRKLDEECTRVKTDPRDATTLRQRLSRYLEGNTRELAVIRIPTEEEEQARHVSRQREQLVHHRRKVEAQGRSLLINHARPAPAHRWKQQTWNRLHKHLSALLRHRLEMVRPALLTLHQPNQLPNQRTGSSCSSESAARSNQLHRCKQNSLTQTHPLTPFIGVRCAHVTTADNVDEKSLEKAANNVADITLY
jgi:transposase